MKIVQGSAIGTLERGKIKGFSNLLLVIPRVNWSYNLSWQWQFYQGGEDARFGRK